MNKTLWSNLSSKHNSEVYHNFVEFLGGEALFCLEFPGLKYLIKLKIPGGFSKKYVLNPSFFFLELAIAQKKIPIQCCLNTLGAIWQREKPCAMLSLRL